MNVNEPNRSALGSSAAAARARQSAQTEPIPTTQPPVSAAEGDLAELVRSLCALAADSPERQAKIQGLIRAYATGNLQVDAGATASAMIDDAFNSRWARR